MQTSYTLNLNFADQELPQLLGGKFVLAFAPHPPVSLQVFRNGVLQAPGVDFLLTGQLVTPLNADWQDDQIVCYYRF